MLIDLPLSVGHIGTAAQVVRVLPIYFMILAYTTAVLFFLAWLLRHDLKFIIQIHYQGNWKLIITMIGLFLLNHVMVVLFNIRTIFQITFILLPQAILIFLCLLNHKISGAKLFALGVTLNSIVMIANGGLMPVTLQIDSSKNFNEGIEIESRPVGSKGIILPYQQTTLWILSDTIPVGRYVISIGDILLIMGIVHFLFQRKKTTP